jgi:putative proteasome-type protease
MTYCVGLLLKDGIVFASDSRTNAGVDNFSQFCKMTVFERPGDRVIVLLSSGGLSGTQSIISVLKQRAERPDGEPNIWTARTMFDVASVVSDATREVERREAGGGRGAQLVFNASFIFGGQIAGEPPRLFRTYAETNFIEAEADSPFLQTGETKYGKPILDRVITRDTSLSDGTKCVLLSFDSTMRSNLSVGLPIDLLCYEQNSLKVTRRRRLDQGDAYFSELRGAWSEGVRAAFTRLPEPTW